MFERYPAFKSIFGTGMQLFFTGCILFLTLVAIEGLLRLQSGLRRIDDIPYITVDGLRVFTPNVDTIVTGGAFTPIHVRTNAEGYASPDYPVVASTSTKRVAFLGNSFTRGFEVDCDKKFTSLAEQYLRELDPEHRYEVMNFGIGGYSFIDQLFVYERYVKKYRPQLVVLVVNPTLDFNTTRVFLPEMKYIAVTPINQLSGSRLLSLNPALSDTASTTATKYGRQLELARFVKRFLAAVTEHLHQLSIKQTGILREPVAFMYKHWLRLGVFDSVAVQAVTMGGDERAFFNPADGDQLKLMRFTAGIALKLGETVTHDGGKFSVVVIPSYWQVDNKYTKQLANTSSVTYDAFLPNKLFQQIVGSKFSILDLSDQIANAINLENTQVFIRDTGHFTAAGHQMAAQSVVDFITKKRFLYP